MSLILILLALHVAASAAGFYWLWRKTERQRAEIARLNELLTTRAAPLRAVRSADGGVVAISELPGQRVRTSPKFTPASFHRRRRTETISPETARTLTLSLMAVAPALGLFIEGGEAAVVASGLAIAAAMMIVALRPVWGVAAWAGVLTAAAWAGVGTALGAPATEPVSFALGLALAGVCGLINAYLRRAAPGAAMALFMAGAALALASQTSLFSAAGASYAILVAAAAIVGAMSLRLDALHLAAFGAAVLGLFVLSGQDSAAIWFTPAAVWTGAVFLAIATVRIPQLGPRAVALAGTGAFAPLGAIFALHDARHGLADPRAAAAAFFALGLALAGILAVSALRRQGGLASLRYTRWGLMLGAFIALAAAVSLIASAQVTALAFALFALSLSALNLRFPDISWRIFAAVSALCSIGFATAAAQAMLAEGIAWPPALVVTTSQVAPALAAGAVAHLFARQGALRFAAFFEATTLIFALTAGHLLTRILFANGAPLLQPVSFVEASSHCSLWLAASLAIGVRMGQGAATLRDNAARGLAAVALAGLVVSGVLWLVSAWPAPQASVWYARASLAFLIPSLLLWGHWWFWRQHKADKRTRVAFATAAATLAVFLVLEFAGLGAPLWSKIGAAICLAAVALGVNLLPVVTASGEPLRLRDKPERSQLPQQA
jgi:hypothetical protein